MSQDVTNNPSKGASASSSLPHQSWSVEADADQLMDDLFADIDRILEGGSKLPSKPVAQPDYVSLQQVVVPTLGLPAGEVTSEEETVGAENQQTTQTAASSKTQTQQEEAEKKKGVAAYLDKILFVTAFASVVGVAGWLVQQQKINLPFLLKAEQSVTEKPVASSAQDPFIEYMQRSLEVIDSQTQATNQTAQVMPPGQTPSNVPAEGGNINLAPAPGQKTIERFYIPTFPPNQGEVAGSATPVAPSPSPAPPAAPPKENQTASQSAPSPTPKSVPSPQPTKPGESQAAASNPPAPQTSHVLVGLMELGDRSAALFKIDGVTGSWVKVGETIGKSGWTLVSVANQEAVIRRNGDVRSISIHQRF